LNRHFSKIVGLSVGQKSLLLAEVTAASNTARPTVNTLAEMPYPEGVSLNTPAELGAALATFLRSRKFGTRDVIIGLPARRLLTRRKEVPAANAEVAAATLRLQAEAEFPAHDADPFAIDYAGQPSPSQPTDVLLVATAQSCVDQCHALAKAAGLKLRGITSSGAALGRATNLLGGEDELIISLASGNAELVVQHGPNPTQLRNLAIANVGTPESMGALAGEIRRTVATLSRNGSPLTLALWDESTDAGSGHLLRDRLGIPVNSPSLRNLVVASNPPSNLNAFAPAVAVALSALQDPGPPVDFLHSRLAPPREKTSKRPVLFATAAGVVLLLAIVAGVVDIQSRQSTLDKLNSRHSARASQIAVAQTAADRLRDARKWTNRKVRYTACLLDLTRLFPDEGNTIWATGFSLSSDNKGVVTGKAVSELYVRALKDKMLLPNSHFLNPTIIQQSTVPSPIRGAPPEHSFSISFTYQPPE
jgi:hypothetical protein